MEQNNTDPLISIIIPTYNREKEIIETLKSIQKQSYKKFECIIVDDGSLDNTENVISNLIEVDSRFVFFKRPSEYKRGGNGARNYGIDLSKGDYIQFFDSDDLMLKDNLKLKLEAILKYDLDLSWGWYKNIAEIKQTEVTYNNIVVSQDEFIYHFFVRNFWIGCTAALWKREIIVNGGLFNEDLLKSQDYEFNLRKFIINKLKYKVVEEFCWTRLDNTTSITQSKKIEHFESLIEAPLMLRRLLTWDYIFKDKIDGFLVYFIGGQIINVKNHCFNSIEFNRRVNFFITTVLKKYFILIAKNPSVSFISSLKVMIGITFYFWFGKFYSLAKEKNKFFSKENLDFFKISEIQ